MICYKITQFQVLFKGRQQNYIKLAQGFMATITFNSTSPSREYTKYISQSKTNPLLNKRNQSNDCFQNLLSVKHVPSKKNYLHINKKNLKKLFTQNAFLNENTIVKERFSIDPSKAFQMKKKQHKMRTVTKSTIEQKIKVIDKKSDLSQQFNTIYVNFNSQSKSNIRANTNTVFSDTYCSNQKSQNFLKGTQSTILKYKKIPKKQAYTSVFGFEASSLQRTNTFHQSQKIRQISLTTHNKKECKKDFFASSALKKQRNRKQLSEWIQKIDMHRQILDPENFSQIKPYVKYEKTNANIKNQQQILKWIRDATQVYKKDSIQKIHKLKSSNEIVCKPDDSFFQQMLKHKARRLQNRQNMILVSSGLSRKRVASQMCETKNAFHTISNTQMTENDFSFSQDEKQEQFHEQKRVKRVRTPLQLLKKLGRQLVSAILQARFQGIQSNISIYKAFWKHPLPYEKSGSYAFFKFLKKGNLHSIQKFIKTDEDFLYQKDHKGRNALICTAAYNNNIAFDFLIEKDINVNFISKNGKTALYYAFKNNNVEMVKKLLQSGANPWSNCYYHINIESTKDQKMKILLKNARKVSIAISMKRLKKDKLKLWNNFKHKINEIQKIKFS